MCPSLSCTWNLREEWVARGNYPSFIPINPSARSFSSFSGEIARHLIFDGYDDGLVKIC